ncbi:MAG: cation:dicarboxylase symporter family transporter [Ignavibacteriae bacterium]|nr:cation:dicarboxylase symporter family transporter [Ignavibacteriota bacterium]
MWTFIKKISLTQWILISMVIGALLGWMFPELSQNIRIISNIFLKLIKVIIVPLLFSTLVVGIAGHSDDLKAVGRLAFKSIIYFEIVTTIALIIGLAAVNLTQPGVGISLPQTLNSTSQVAVTQMSWKETIEHLVPKSFFESAANNDVLQIVVFAILFGIALTQVKGKPKEAILGFCEGLSEVMFKFTGIVMKFAPFGIGAAMCYTVGHSGIGILMNLGQLIATLYGSLIVMILFVFIPILFLFKIPIKRFAKAVEEPALIAFSTTSSDAALPVALENMVKFGVPRRIVSFVLPTGYSFNLDGSTLYLSIASIFVAQAAGVHLDLWHQLTIMFTLMLTTKGIAAVPRASIVILSGTLVTFGLPLEGVAILLGVDEIMDMARTGTNLVGNCLASTVMARMEGELNIENPSNHIYSEN